jgi:hypothetical protein
MIILTTEKDLGGLPIASVPLIVGVEPADVFRNWLVDRIWPSRASARPERAEGRTPPQSSIHNPQ